MKTSTFLAMLLCISLSTSVWADYDADAAVAYAEAYCTSHNSIDPCACDPYQDYSVDDRGGDCANFVSQCLIAGGLDLGAGVVDECGCIVSCTNLNYFLVDDVGAGYELRATGEDEPAWFSAGDVAIFSVSEDRWQHAVIAVAGDSEQANDALCAAHTADVCARLKRSRCFILDELSATGQIHHRSRSFPGKLTEVFFPA